MEEITDYYFTVVVEIDNVCKVTIPSFLLLFLFLLLIVEVAATVINEMQPMLPLGTVHMEFLRNLKDFPKCFISKHDIAKGNIFQAYKLLFLVF